MSVRDEDEAPANRSAAESERIDADHVDLSHQDHLLPKFDMPVMDHLLPKLDMPVMDHLLPKFDMPVMDHLLPKFDMPVMDHLLPKLDMPVMNHLMPNSLTNWLDWAVPRVDMAAWSNVVGTASAVNTRLHDAISAAARTMLDIDRSYRAFDDLLSPALRNMQSRIDEFTRLAPVIQSAAGMWSTQITDLMHGWTVLSGVGHRLAGKALHLAVAIRDALINDADRDAVRRVVIDFMRRVLGYRGFPTEARIEAVSAALLDDAWLPTAGNAFDGDYNPIKPLRKIVASEHGLWLPLSETRPLGGRRMASLEKPNRVALGSDEGNPARPMDRLEAAEFTPEREPITLPALKRVMDPLTPIEREIVWAKYYEGARTWADAATMCGRKASEGETTRRRFLKLKNAEKQRRSA